MITTGDLRFELEAELRRRLAGIIAAKHALQKYFVLVHTRWESESELVTKFVTLKNKPVKMLGTICYEVDNVKGTLRQLWCLPKDIPLSDGHMDPDRHNEKIRQQAGDMPIVHS